MFRHAVLVTVLVCWCCVWAAPTLHAAPARNWKFPQADRVVSFADVHGAYDELTVLLRQVGVIDEQDNWSGGSTRLVSTGDLVDRGADSRKVIELLMRLQKQAKKAGGGVHVALGNHELMLATGDLRYVSAAEYAAFADDESAAERQALLEQYLSLRPDQDPAALQQAFDEKYPPGFIALSRAFSKRGKIGKWLLSQPLALQIGGTVYVHGGLSNSIVKLSIDELNVSLKKEMREYQDLVESLTKAGVLRSTIGFLERPFYLEKVIEPLQAAKGKRRKPSWLKDAKRLIELQDGSLFTEMSPLWYRGNASCHPYVEAFDVERVLARWNARRVVVGHTPTPTRRVRSRLEGQVVLADTGMLSSVYRGRASALLIEAGKLSAIYAGEPGQHALESEVPRVARQPQGMDDAAMEKFLATAPIVANVAVGTGVTNPRRLTLEQDGRRMDAVFKYYDSHEGLESFATWVTSVHEQTDRYVYDIAAYRLDRMLDLHMVPVAVERVVDGKPGMVQMWVENTINERDRREQGVEFAGRCPQWTQYRLRFVFDVLIYNEDRNLTNILWTSDDFRLMFIDHSLAFRSSIKRPEQYSKLRLDLPEILRSRLSALDEGRLTEELGSYLHPRQISAILKRRDRILKQATRTGFDLH